MLRRAAHAGFTADEVAAATFAAATERKRPGPLVRVLFAECTNADAGYDAERLVDAFPGMIEAEGALLDDLPDRLDRFHYDLVATTTFHADEAQALVAGRVPVVAMLVGPGLPGARPRDRRPAARLAGRPRLRVGARRGEHPRDAGDRRARPGVEIVSALIGDAGRPRRDRPDRRPHPHVARGAGRRARPHVLDGRIGSGRGPTTSTRPAWSSSAAPSSTSRAARPAEAADRLTAARPRPAARRGPVAGRHRTMLG